MKPIFSITKFEIGGVYLNNTHDEFFDYKPRVVGRGPGRVIYYSLPKQETFTAVARVDIFNGCEYVIVPYSQYHDGRMYFSADKKGTL